MLADRERLLAHLRELHAHIRQSVVAQAERSTLDALSMVDSEDTSAGARTFALDRLGEAAGDRLSRARDRALGGLCQSRHSRAR